MTLPQAAVTMMFAMAFVLSFVAWLVRDDYDLFRVYFGAACFAGGFAFGSVFMWRLVLAL